MTKSATEDAMTTCYACPKPPTTSEHVPPKCLFPERKDTPGGIDLRRNLITIPSCDEHNMRKSGDDEYLMHILNSNLLSNEVAGEQVRTKIFRSIERRPALFQSIFKDKEPLLVKDGRTGEVYETVEGTLDGNRLERVLAHIARGIYFHHYRKRWDCGLRVFPEFSAFPYEANAAEINSNAMTVVACAELLFAKVDCYGDNPDVFSYQFLETNEFKYILRLSFYEGTKVTVHFL